jgi:hypothetical protein
MQIAIEILNKYTPYRHLFNFGKLFNALIKFLIAQSEQSNDDLEAHAIFCTQMLLGNPTVVSRRKFEESFCVICEQHEILDMRSQRLKSSMPITEQLYLP